MINKKRKSRVPAPINENILWGFYKVHGSWDISNGISLKTNPTPRAERNYDTSPSKPNRFLKTIVEDFKGVRKVEWVKQ